VNEPDPLKCVVDIQDREAKKCLIALASHRAMSPLRQALPRHSASRRVCTPQLTLGALELQKTNTEKSLSLPPFAVMSPLRQQGARQALPRHSASRQVSTPQLTLGALELQNTNTEKSLS
jgi:hypothetical protein